MAAGKPSPRNLRAQAGLSKKNRGKQGERMRLALEVLQKESPENFEQALRDAQGLAVRLIEGQCRKQVPYAPIRFILGKKGMQYCCTHKPEPHCGSMSSGA